MQKILSVLTLGLMLGVSVYAQDPPKADLMLGYSFLRANSARNIPAFTNNGGLGSFAWNFTKNIAGVAEFGGYHNGNVSDIQFDTTEMTYLFGPRFSWDRTKVVDPFVHVLLGGIHFTSSIAASDVLIPTPATTVPASGRFAASTDAFAMALGGGLDIKLAKWVALRAIQLDYVMTRLEDFGQSGQPSENRNQHHLRFATGFVFNFGGAQ